MKGGWTQSPANRSLNLGGFPAGWGGKESACNAGELGLIPGLGRSRKGEPAHPLQYFCLENPHGQRSLVGYSPRDHRVRHDWVTKYSTAQGISSSCLTSLKQMQDVSRKHLVKEVYWLLSSHYLEFNFDKSYDTFPFFPLSFFLSPRNNNEIKITFQCRKLNSKGTIKLYFSLLPC